MLAPDTKTLTFGVTAPRASAWFDFSCVMGRIYPSMTTSMTIVIVLPRSQPEGAATGRPSQVQVIGVGVAGVVEADLVELGELPVVACHRRVGIDHVGLGAQHLHVGRSSP